MADIMASIDFLVSLSRSRWPRARNKLNVKQVAALPFVEIAAFLVNVSERQETTALALEFTILTAARSGEVRGMTWAELDIEKKLWTVPGIRMKAGATHQVPLSDTAVAIVTGLKNKTTKHGDFVFKAPRGGAFPDMALSQLLKRMGQADITVHGFRSSFRDWAGEKTQFGREEVEMALAHTLGSSVGREYRQGRALEKRRELLAAWADYCAGKLVVAQQTSESNDTAANR